MSHTYTTPSAVRGLLGDAVSEETDISYLPELAHIIVAKWCPAYDASTQTDGYTAEQLEAIERLVAAHIFTATPEGQVGPQNLVREKAGEVEEEYNRRVLGPGFDSSEFGRLAMLYDWRGALAALNNKMKTVTQQVPAGKKRIVAGESIGGGPEPLNPYDRNLARWW